ncbi:MAG: PLP-dependent aspartate aminotransferase family protein [Bifidobacteriaceae bacterium]|nr:PLP-dependent aspartate aminotransferase family protein [Bifidobacteriaceae bacterium]
MATVFALFEAGDRIVLAGDVYCGSHRLLTQVWRRFGVKTTSADASRPAVPSRAPIRPGPSSPRLNPVAHREPPRGCL